MLQIVVPAVEETSLWDEQNERFVHIPAQKEQTLQLEHSLISLSKWESKWCKPFLTEQEMSNEETLDYVRCMTLTKNVDPNIYYRLSEENINDIYEYIHAPMTATTINNKNQNQTRRRKRIITSELLYCWMISLNIPIEVCEKWHIKRLITLIEVCNAENEPAKKTNKRDLASQYAALNAARRKKYNTKG